MLYAYKIIEDINRKNKTNTTINLKYMVLVNLIINSPNYITTPIISSVCFFTGLQIIPNGSC